MTSLPLCPTIEKYLKNLQQNKEIVSTKTNNNIPFNEYKQGFKKWKESTTTSPSGRHLGHHHSLLSLYGTQYNKNKEDFRDRMWHIHHNIISIVLLNEKKHSLDGLHQLSSCYQNVSGYTKSIDY